MTLALVGLALIAALALSGWLLSELELRDAHHELDELQRDLDIAVGWHERQIQQHAVIHPSLHLIDGGDA